LKRNIERCVNRNDDVAVDYSGGGKSVFAKIAPIVPGLAQHARLHPVQSCGETLGMTNSRHPAFSSAANSCCFSARDG
jgi:hypothetical protein